MIFELELIVFFFFLCVYRGAMDGRGAQAILAGVAEGRERRLERDF